MVGVDEAGRGAWAGPVAAAAVMLPADRPDLTRRLAGVRDSKMLTPRRRETLVEVIQREAMAVGVAFVGPEVIVEQGIAAATRQAMMDAIDSLLPPPDYLLIDYVRLPQTDVPQRNVVRGDQKSLAIAAASIVAKVARDQVMARWEQDFPGYGFRQHKGYGTRAHRAALGHLGMTPLHRRNWRPMLALGEVGRDLYPRGLLEQT